MKTTTHTTTLTEKQMVAILKDKKINSCTKEQKEQIFDFAFGKQFMDSNDKGRLTEYDA